MERIIIEVEDATAKKWQNVPLLIKSQMEEIFARQIDMLDQDIKTKDFKALLDKVSDEAAQNGLTEEILQQLLNGE